MYDDFGNKLKTLREAHNWTQEELGSKINRSKSLICMLENNLSMPTGEVLIDLASLFHVSLDFLVGIDKNEMIATEGLTSRQKELIHLLILEFRADQRHNRELTQRKRDLVNLLLIEFFGQ